MVEMILVNGWKKQIMGTSLETERIIGPLGSEFFHLKVPPDMFPDFARLDWNTIGKRVMIDPTGGIISWMSPAEAHSITVRTTDRIVERSADFLKWHVVPVGDNRWRPPPDKAAFRVEADSSYYIGKTAIDYYAAIRDVEDETAAEKKFCRQNPPDLVVEVEVTNRDAGKPAKYKTLGVREMWQVKARSSKGPFQPEVVMLDLQAEGGPQPIAQSMVLPGLKAGTLPRAYHLARHGRLQTLQTLLEKDLIVLVPTTSKPPVPSSFQP